MNTLEVWITKPNKPTICIAVIQPYNDPSHPRRKFCYQEGQSYVRIYSETATSLSDMLYEYLDQNVDWGYCIANDIAVEIRPVIR